MAQKNQTVETTEATVMEAFLLQLADVIYATFGNSGAAKPEDIVTKPAAKAPAAKTKPKAAEKPAEVEADEVDADEDEDLEAERKALEKLSVAALRKKLIELGYDPAEVKAEKDKATLIEIILSDDDEDEDDEDADDEEDDADEAEDSDDDDEDDEEEDDEDDEDSPYTAEELDELSLAELKEIAAEMELDIPKGARTATYKKAILEAQEMAEDEDADEDEDDEDDEDRAELEALTLPELRKKAKDVYGLTAREIKGLDKDGILDLIFEDDEEA